jgi:hypothetical protein
MLVWTRRRKLYQMMSPEEIEIVEKYQTIHNQLIEIERDMANLRDKAHDLMNQLEELRVKEIQILNNNSNG